MKKQTAQLEWTRRLPEAGTIAGMADREAEMLERRAGLLEQIAAIDARLADMRKNAEKEAASLWTAAEVQRAKDGGK